MNKKVLVISLIVLVSALIGALYFSNNPSKNATYFQENVQKEYSWQESGKNSRVMGNYPHGCEYIGGTDFRGEIIKCDSPGVQDKDVPEVLTVVIPATTSTTISTKNDDEEPDHIIVVEPPVDDSEGENNKKNNGNHYGNDKPDNNPKDFKNKHDGEDSYDDHHGEKEKKNNK